MQQNAPAAEKLDKLFTRHHGILQRQQVLDAGLHPRLLSQFVRTGRAERLQPGVYRHTDAEPLTNESLLEVALRVPYGVVCLGSALAFHELGTVSPAQVHLAIPNHAWRPQINHPPVRYFYFSDRTYAYGIQTHAVGPGEIKVYSPEKTLADLLYFRNKLGKRMFLEGLDAYLESPSRNIPQLIDAAKVRRVERVMQPYLEAKL